MGLRLPSPRAGGGGLLQLAPGQKREQGEEEGTQTQPSPGFFRACRPPEKPGGQKEAQPHPSVVNPQDPP
jgi:hypothetical protein